MSLPRDWRAFIESLNFSGVEYLIVGAVAVAHHGFPRYTGDLDILVRNSPENARRLEGVLQGFGFGDLGLTAADFIDSTQLFQWVCQLTGTTFLLPSRACLSRT